MFIFLYILNHFIKVL